MRVVFGAERGRFGIYAKGCLGRVLLSTSLLETRVISHDTHLSIGSLMFDGMDQIDLTGPFEALSRLPNSSYQIYAKTSAPVRDLNGLRLLPDATLDAAPQCDVLHIPGGPGQEALMEDQVVLDWIQRQAGGARYVFSVCTGALLCGAAGLLIGRRATTHWSSLHRGHRHQRARGNRR
jgi:cyclohexyl-isocyanide hydratase